MPVQAKYHIGLDVTHEEYEALHGTLLKHESAVVIERLQKTIIEKVNLVIAQDEDFYTELAKKYLRQPPYDKIPE